MYPFPAPLALPEKVSDQRFKRQQEIVKTASRGIGIRLGIILFELVGFYIFSSSVLLLDALASLVDVASTFCLILCVRLAEKPPDEDHPFGHGRYEPLTGFLLSLMLAIIGVGLLIQQLVELNQIQAINQIGPSTDHIIDSRAWIIPAISLILLEICYRVVMRTAQKQHSPALAADAIHYRVDGIATLCAMIALILAALFPQGSFMFDHVGAGLISLLMIGMGLYAARDNFHQLMDRVPDPKFFAQVRQAALRVADVKDTEKIRIQSFGPDAHVNIDIEVDPQLTVEVAHKISQEVRIEIQKEWPAVRDVTVHIEPYYLDDH